MSAVKGVVAWYRSLAIAWQAAVAGSWVVFAASGLLGGGGGAGTAVAETATPAVVAEADAAHEVAAEGSHAPEAAAHEAAPATAKPATAVEDPMAVIDYYARHGMCIGVTTELEHWQATPGASAAAYAAYAEAKLAEIGC